MMIYVSAQMRRGASGDPIQLEGWRDGQSGPVDGPAFMTLSQGMPRRDLVCVAIEPASAHLSVMAAGGSLHYSRLADATLRPLPAVAAWSLARGDAYIALTPGALRLADSPAIARFLHLHDNFNAQRLAESVLAFLAQESGRTGFPEDVTVLVVEAR
jgi:hypothetical protein